MLREGLRDDCRVSLGVPPGSSDVEAARGNDADHRRLSLEVDGSSESGGASVLVDAPSDAGAAARREYVLDVELPRHFDMFHALGHGKYFFRFSFFATGEGSSFHRGRVEVTLPDGYSYLEANPAADGLGASRTWTLKAGRDFEALVSFKHDLTRTAVGLAPEAAFVALGLFLAFVSFRPRREEAPVEAPVADEREALPEPQLETLPTPVPEPQPEPLLPEPQPESLLPEPEPEPEREPEPALVHAPPPVPEPRPVLTPEPPVVETARASRSEGRSEALVQAGAFGLALAAVAYVVRLVRSRRR